MESKRSDIPISLQAIDYQYVGPFTMMEEHLNSLDAAAPKDGALARIDRCHKPAGYVVSGNSRGLVRFGVECIRAGLDQTEDARTFNESQLDALEYLQAQEGECIWFQRQEKIVKRDREKVQKWTEMSWKIKAIFILIFLGAGVTMFIFGLGAYTAIKWLI